MTYVEGIRGHNSPSSVLHIQWNLSIVDTLGTVESVMISKVSTFGGSFTHLYLVSINAILISGVSL